MRRTLKKAFRTYADGGLSAFRSAIRRKLDYSRRNKIYRRWIEQYDTLSAADIDALREKANRFEKTPLISILMPVYNVEERFLREALDSVLAQVYEHWELCIADDRSTKPHVRRVLDEYTKRDSRFKVVFRETNGHISAASNSALEQATGEFTALMDHDDVLAVDALYHVAVVLNDAAETNLIYSDEDKIDADGRRYFPMFKPDWSPELFHSINLVTHLCVFRTSILLKIGGFRVGLEGSQDYDLSLRFVEQIDAGSIRHVPHVLYHWRAIPGSVALDSSEKTYAHERARTAITEHFESIGLNAKAVKGKGELHRAVFDRPTKTKVSLIVGPEEPSEELIEQLRSASPELVSEVILPVDYESDDTRMRTRAWNDESHFEWMNLVSQSANGDVLIFLRGDTTSISDGGIEELAARAMIDGVGAVGGQIISRAGTILHAGYLLGVKNGIGRAHYGSRLGDIGAFVRLAVDQNFSAVSSDFFAIRRATFEALGGFDHETFDEAYADIELCLRLTDSGRRVMWTPWATAVQPDRRTPPFNAELAKLKECWPKAFANDPFYNPNLTLESEDLLFAFPPRVSRRIVGARHTA